MTAGSLLTALHHSAACLGYAVTLRKVFLMFKQAFGIALQVFGTVALLVAAVEEQGLPDGAAKKAAAASQIDAELKPVLPAWAQPIVASLLPFLIDQGVAYANRSGFFTKSAAA